MKKLMIESILLLFSISGFSQSTKVDSLLNLLNVAESDSVKINIYKKLGYHYQNVNQYKAIEYFEIGISVARKAKRNLDMANCYFSIGYCHLLKGEFPKSIDNYLQSIRIYENLKDSFRLSTALMSVANVYMNTKDIEKQNEYLDKNEKLVERLRDSTNLCNFLNFKGNLYDQRGVLDSALIFLQKAYQIALVINDTNSITSTLINIGLTLKHLKREDDALECFAKAIRMNGNTDDLYFLAVVYNNMGATYAQKTYYTKALIAFDKSISYGLQADIVDVLMENYRNLADLYGDMKDYSNQVFFLKKYQGIKDSLFTIEKNNQTTQLVADYIIEKKNLQIIKSESDLLKQKNQRYIYFSLFIISIVVLGLLILLYRRTKTKNQLLESKNIQIIRQKEDLQTTIVELTATQAQLIQSEKMASLGELTAGIAHEIQNPLNFVNNFSEVSKELLSEMKDELAEGNWQSAKEIASDVEQNLEKINHHGKRADAIVKGMLQHSRSGSGQKEPTDINALCDEFLRLAYHGMKAKDNSFEASFHFEPDENLPKANVVPQDIGRVLLNLINNAFQAVNGYGDKPTVTVTTRKTVNSVEVQVADNGPGIPESIKDKIFQPFFTTKPTGQGTGLGLSLSYDIVKAHGGELKVETKEGQGSEFIIQLPTI